MLKKFVRVGIELNQNAIYIVFNVKTKGCLFNKYIISYDDMVFYDQLMDKKHLIIKALLEMRKFLPKKPIFHLVLPSHWLWQQWLMLPEEKLMLRERDVYIKHVLKNNYSLPVDELVFDCCHYSSQKWFLAVAQKQYIDFLHALFQESGLVLAQIDTPPCLLYRLARYLSLPQDAVLLYKTFDHWCVLQPLTTHFSFLMVKDDELLSVLTEDILPLHIVTNVATTQLIHYFPSIRLWQDAILEKFTFVTDENRDNAVSPFAFMLALSRKLSHVTR